MTDHAEFLAELRALRAEVVALREAQAKEAHRARLSYARTMAMLLGLARPMTAEAAARIEKRLMALDPDDTELPR